MYPMRSVAAVSSSLLVLAWNLPFTDMDGVCICWANAGRRFSGSSSVYSATPIYAINDFASRSDYPSFLNK